MSWPLSWVIISLNDDKLMIYFPIIVSRTRSKVVNSLKKKRVLYKYRDGCASMFFLHFSTPFLFSICSLHKISSLRSRDSEWRRVKEWQWHNEKESGVMPGVLVAFPGTNEQSKVCWHFPHLYFVLNVCACAGYCLFHKGTKNQGKDLGQH